MTATGRSLLNGFDVCDYPFKNFLKMAGFPGAANGTYAFPAILDGNGYPTASPGSNYQFQLQFPYSYFGTWRLYWTGKFSLGLALNSGTATIVSNPSGAGSGSGTANLAITAASSSSIDFTLSAAGSLPGEATITFAFTAGTYTPGINLVMCRVSAPYTGDQAAIDSGVLTEQFNDDFLTSIRKLNPSILRPLLNNNPDNGGNVSRWKYRKPVASLSYNAPLYYPNSVAGDSGSGAMKTLNTADAYSIASYPDMPGSWTDGEMIHVQWSAANTTTTPTLDVGSRGAKTIVNTDAAAVSAGRLALNDIGTLLYDITLDKLLYVHGAINVQWPPEILCALANKLGKNLHLQIPTHYDVPSVQSLAAFVRDNLNSDLVFFPDYSNEMWNFFGGFEQTSWAVAYGAALGFPLANSERYQGVYALRLAQFMPAIATVWTANGRSRSTLKCVMAFQFFGNSGVNGAEDKYRFKGFDLNTSLGYAGYNSLVGVNYNTFPNRPVDVCDIFHYAPYYSGAQCTNTDSNYSNASSSLSSAGPTTGVSSPPWTTGLLGAADAFALGGATNIADALAFMDWDVRQGTRNGSAGGNTLVPFVTKYAAWETTIAQYDGNRPTGRPNLEVGNYESGYEAIYPSVARCATLSPTIDSSYGGATGKIGNLLTAYKNSALFRQMILDQMAQFATGHAGRTATPGWFIYNQLTLQWALFPGDAFTTPYQSFDALSLYNNHKRRLVVKT